MNKKVLGFVLASIFLAMLVAPAIAGKGQEKLSFKLVMIGHYMPPAKVVETENTVHYFDLGFICQNPLTADPALTVEIDGVTLPDSRLGGGTGLIHLNARVDAGYTIQVNDMITILADDGHVMGDIVTVAMGNLNNGNGVGGGMNFEGHGTDELEGVKVKGVTTGVVPIGTWTAPSGVELEIIRVERVGTIMGW
jgi:hypothetical protein